MSGTTEPSKKRTAVAGTAFKANVKENTIDIPENGKVYEAIIEYVGGQGNIEIPAGNGKLNENGILETENANINMGEKAYKATANNRAKRNEMKGKVRTTQAGIESR